MARIVGPENNYGLDPNLEIIGYEVVGSCTYIYTNTNECQYIYPGVIDESTQTITLDDDVNTGIILHGERDGENVARIICDIHNADGTP